MALYAISDLHLPLGVDKPMDIFGKNWENYVTRLEENWKNTVQLWQLLHQQFVSHYSTVSSVNCSR